MWSPSVRDPWRTPMPSGSRSGRASYRVAMRSRPMANKIVGEHARAFGRGKDIYDPLHDVPVLARKPGAFRNGAPFKAWELPAAMWRVRAASSDACRTATAPLSGHCCAMPCRAVDGRDPERGPDRRAGGGGRGPRRGFERGRPFVRGRPEHPRPPSRQRRASSTTNRRRR
jgi:hypothetical protein